MHDADAYNPDADDIIDRLTRIAQAGPYFTLDTGESTDESWRPTAMLRDRKIRDEAIAEMAARLGVTEVRVAASTLQFGFAARLWSIAVGTRRRDGRCIDLAPNELLWRTTGGTLELRIEAPRFGRSVRIEVIDRQLEPCIEAWRDIVAPGLLWGNTTSAFLGAIRIAGISGSRWVRTTLDDPRLQTTFDAQRRRRRSCCLFYRTPTGGVCGDCPFPTPPSISPAAKE